MPAFIPMLRTPRTVTFKTVAAVACAAGCLLPLSVHHAEAGPTAATRQTWTQEGSPLVHSNGWCGWRGCHRGGGRNNQGVTNPGKTVTKSTTTKSAVTKRMRR
jgi:hypothetical protein